jgi:small GTP-binding protein
MKRRWADDFNRRSFLTDAAAAVIGVTLGSQVSSQPYADEALNSYVDNGAFQGSTELRNSSQLIKKKVCMLGASGVGKTCLVKRYVESLYNENYLNSVGVKIDKKEVEIDKRRMLILLWDIKGGDDFQSLRTSYLRGASGIMLVVDGTRRRTLEVALDFHKRIYEEVGTIPSVVSMFNKDDLSSQWEVHNSEIESLAAKNIPVVRGSAKTGKGVEDAFFSLASKMLNQ